MGLRFDDVRYAYDGVPALKGITLEARKGEILCLLGRSGCGKSTLLNLTAGLLDMQAGSITLDGAPLAVPGANPAPEKRPVGLVFQDGALFPHLTVAQNIGFGLGPAGRDVVVETLLGQIGLPGHGTRYPHTLSGGQQQRVAVARALAPEPDVLLMDEPFASIDISLRRKLREETRRLVKARESVTLLVTHDPEEALEIADRIAVLEDGQITQVGTARELHDAPASLFVGLMAGSGAVVRGTVSDGGCETPFGRFAAQDIDAKDGTHGREVDILIHPHRASLMADVEGLFISDLRETGRSQIVTLRRADGDTLLVEVGLTPGWAVGDRVSLKPEGGAWPAFAV